MNSGLTVYYIDDDQDDREFFSEIVDLVDENARVITFKNGQDLLDAIELQPQERACLFLDINMPGMNGFEVLSRLRESYSHRVLPVIMFSTSDDTLTIEKSKELGANLFVQKSALLENLRQSIRHALNINWETFEPGETNFVYKV
jgi:CheY-like chemotaxis protein